MKEVVPYNRIWVADFQDASKELSSAFVGLVVRIHHIGSTSIPGIFAKPIIDILVEVSDIERVDSKNETMEEIGYESMGEYGISARRYFRRINEHNIRTHHVHVFETQNDNVNRHLAFRDYLIAHPHKAQEYSELKKELVATAGSNWELYVNGKDSFVKATEQLALSWTLGIK